MGTQLALLETPALPAPSNPARLPSLPAWLQHRSAELASANSGSYQKIPLLPASLILDSAERAIVEQHIGALQVHLDLDQPFAYRDKVLTNDQGISAMVAALLIKGGGAKLDQASSDALTEDYLDALEDLPAWCVREALRKWNRGESPPLDGKPHDYNWRPTPPTVRRLALLERATIAGRVHVLNRLLIAAPIPEFSDEHRKSMLDRLAAAMPRKLAEFPKEPTEHEPAPLSDAARKSLGIEPAEDVGEQREAV